MANYPQIDDCQGVWKLKEVNNAVMGGYWRQGGSRAVFGGGYTSDATYTNVLDFITIASTGDATDFGDLGQVKSQETGTAASLTRGFYMTNSDGSAVVNRIDVITIMTAGNSADFGDTSTAVANASSLSNSIRGVKGGGATVNTIDFITMSTYGNAADFGDLTVARQRTNAAASPTRGLYGGGLT